MALTVGQFDRLIESYLPDLLGEIRSTRDVDLYGEDVSSLEDATSTYTVYGEAVIHVFPHYLREICHPVDPERLKKFMAFLEAWDDLSDGAVRSDVIPVWLRDDFYENPVTLEYLPQSLSASLE
jgi:hypothetical protein